MTPEEISSLTAINQSQVTLLKLTMTLGFRLMELTEDQDKVAGINAMIGESIAAVENSIAAIGKLVQERRTNG
ncbi:hypothetical protein P3T40_003433 [Paraburkholderia sp. EB58]|uniref:hypothetical protein n=1 Tax=Paraburkholderia sp. EB58 TaxID=3035125 RepID=UPI003D236314